MTPEQKARQKIDEQLDQAGWVIRDMIDFNPSAHTGVAVREFPMEDGPADCLLFMKESKVEAETS